MLKTNVKKLVKISVIGEIASPTIRNPYNVSATGNPLVLPGVGGITYNVRVGDPACGWEADHVEPCVSTVSALKTKKMIPAKGKQPTLLLTFFHVLEIKQLLSQAMQKERKVSLLASMVE